MSPRSLAIASLFVLAVAPLTGCKKKVDWSQKPLTSQEKSTKDIKFTIDLPDGLEESAIKLNGEMALIEKGNLLSGIQVSVSETSSMMMPDSEEDAVKDADLMGDHTVLKKAKLGEGFVVAATNKEKSSLFVDQWIPAGGDQMLHCRANDIESKEIKNAATLQPWLEKICASIKVKGAPAAGAGGTHPTSGVMGVTGMSVPADWPAEFPMYTGGKVVSASSTTSDKTKSYSTMIESTDSPEQVLAFYTEKATAAGYKQSTTSETTSNGAVRKTVIFQKGKYGKDGSMVLMVGPGFVDKTKTSATVSITRIGK